MSAEYELVLMLDPETPDERRDQIAADARGRIEAGGSLKAENAWGMRKLAYEIQQRTEADYRFFRFETESPVLDEIDHSHFAFLPAGSNPTVSRPKPATVATVAPPPKAAEPRVAADLHGTLLIDAAEPVASSAVIASSGSAPSSGAAN